MSREKRNAAMCLGGEDIQKLVGGFSNPTPFEQNVRSSNLIISPTKLQ